jgi:membrane protein insertase Oxa1/YidC/SpoIIIJ
MAGVSKLMSWLAPFGVLVPGWFFPVPIGLLRYFLVTSVWTLVQRPLLTAPVDREPDYRPWASGTP